MPRADGQRAISLAPAPFRVALVCPEPRLRRMLSLMLGSDGLAVFDWVPGSPLASSPALLVTDLDSLGWDAAIALGRLTEAGVSEMVPIVSISIYPQDQENSGIGGRVSFLQPPFTSLALSRLVRSLLVRALPCAPETPARDDPHL